MRTLAVIIMAIMLALGIASNANASDSRAINDAARLQSASLDFAAQLRYLGGSNSLRGDAEKLSREASRLRSAMHAGYSGRQLQARYDELVKYYYRFERNYQRNNFGYRFDSGFRNVNLAFHSLNSSYLYAWNSSNRHYPRGFESYGRSNTVDIHIFNNRNFDNRRYDNHRYDNRRSYKYDDRRYNSWDRSRRSQDHRRDVQPQNHYKGSAGSYGDRRRH